LTAIRLADALFGGRIRLAAARSNEKLHVRKKATVALKPHTLG